MDLVIDDVEDRREIALEGPTSRYSSNELDVLEPWLAGKQWNCF